MVGNLAVGAESRASQQNAPLLTVVDLSALRDRVPGRRTATPRDIGSACRRRSRSTAGNTTRRSDRDFARGAPERGHRPRALRGRAAGRACARTSACSVRIVMDQRDNVLKVERGAFYRSGRRRTPTSCTATSPCARRSNSAPPASAKSRSLNGLEPGDQIVDLRHRRLQGRRARSTSAADRPQPFQRDWSRQCSKCTNLSKVYRTDLHRDARAARLLAESGATASSSRSPGPRAPARRRSSTSPGLLETFDSGTYRLDGEDVSRLDDDARSRCATRRSASSSRAST